MAVTLKDEKILDTWAVVMEGGAGHADALLQDVQDLLKSSDLPGITWGKVDAQPGMLKGFFGKKREYLRIVNEALKDYRMYLGAQEYSKGPY